MNPMKLVIAPTILARSGIKESTVTHSPPSIRRGIIGTKKILASGETHGKSPEKYIMYGSIKSGSPIASIKSSRRLILPSGIHEILSFRRGRIVIINSVARNER